MTYEEVKAVENMVKAVMPHMCADCAKLLRTGLYFSDLGFSKEDMGMFESISNKGGTNGKTNS